LQTIEERTGWQKRYGHRCSPAERLEVEQLIRDFEQETPAPKQLDLTDSLWKLVYTASTASSSGKLGPVVGKVTQRFPSNKPGQYINRVAFGPVSLDLLADYSYKQSDYITVDFVHIQLILGDKPVFTKDFRNAGGYWKVKVANEDVRVLYSNSGSVFVLKRIQDLKEA
jgi:hypothetical protein